MKKCPKCGTVLDDSKKKCYMCGTDLLKSSSASFGDSFNAQIGATMSGGQNNAFNSTKNVNEINNVNFNNVSSNIGGSRGSSNLFQNQLNGLNSLQYDDRTKFEKMLDNNDKKKKDKKTKDKKQDVINNTAAFNTGNRNEQNNMLPSNNLFPNITDFNVPPQNQMVGQQTAVKQRGKVNSEKPDINWGNNLGSSNKDVFKFRDKVDKKNGSRFSLSVLFNFVCFLICLGGIAFVYFKFIKGSNSDEIVSLGGLKYTIDRKFLLETNDSHSKFYKYGDNCGVRLSYGVTNNPDGFIENYFERVKDDYSNKEDYNTSIQKITINDNEWSEIRVQGLKENAAAPGGFSFYTKYKYIAIVYKGNYFDIVYANPDDDNTCSAMYDTLIKSFSFD